MILDVYFTDALPVDRDDVEDALAELDDIDVDERIHPRWTSTERPHRTHQRRTAGPGGGPGR